MTLLELLISIVILSILSAIALPSFLNFSSRARHSEARVNLGSIFRAQQGYYLANGEFATELSDLALGISDSENYTYRIHPFDNHRTPDGLQVSGSTAVAVPESAIRGYMGKIWVDTPADNPQLPWVLCEGAIDETYFMGGRTYCQ